MTTIIAPIVGMFFRLKEDGVPAQAIINNLPSGTPLLLQAEPDNEYDPFAIKVIITHDNIPHNEEIEMEVSAKGMTPAELYASMHHLGYVDSTKTGAAKRLQPLLHLLESSTLVFQNEKPGVQVILKEEEK